MSALGTINAQEVTMTNDALSKQYAQQSKVLDSEIKTLKIKLKDDKGNTQLQSELTNKKMELAELKSKKNTLDTAIKTKKNSEAAAKKAEKALIKAQKAQKEAESIRNAQ